VNLKMKITAIAFSALAVVGVVAGSAGAASTTSPTVSPTGLVWGCAIVVKATGSTPIIDYHGKYTPGNKCGTGHQLIVWTAGTTAPKAGPKGDPGTPGAKGDKGDPGTNGTNGTDGKDGKDGDAAFKGAYYAVAKYDVGDTNGGAIATVACNDTTDVAVSGGVQTLGLGGKATPISSSFPGRMDWTTNTPKADRLDGWIVQFDGTVAPEKVNIWALCVPGITVSTDTNFTESAS
jgi:hypothetical protein